MEFGSKELLTFYEAAHQNSLNRYIHHIAHIIAFLGILALPLRPIATIASVVLAFILSWSGHYLFERNKPAFFETKGLSISGVLRHQTKIALGGVWWSYVCFLRLLRLGPLT